MALNDIADRLTPSVPTEITYGATPIAAGTKVATLFAHSAQATKSPGFVAHDMISVGDPDAAQAEMDDIAGAGSQASAMVRAFVQSNSIAGRTNYPAFRVILLPFNEPNFGPNQEAFHLAQVVRNDIVVSPYPASDSANLTLLANFVALISGPDRDLNGQFGTTGVLGSCDVAATAFQYAANQRSLQIAWLQDTSTTPANNPEILAAAKAAQLLSIGQPYRPGQGMVLGGIKAPAKRSDWVMIDPNGLSESALRFGLSPLTVQPGGAVGVIRDRMTLTLKSDGITAVTDYIDWQQIQKLFDYREALYQASQNPPFNNNPGGSLLTADIANKFGDEMLRIANDYEKAGMFQNVKLLAKYFVAQASTTSRGRLDARIPVDCVPGLFVIATNIIAVSDAANFTI